MKMLFTDAIRKFNERARTDEKLKKELKGITRKIQIDVADGEDYNFVLRDLQISDLCEGRIESPDIVIGASTETFTALLAKEMGPMKAIATRKLKIKASLEDMFRLRKFF
ncbi:MAG: SCP2 sterol-binding domain-containing protein [Thermoplasmata archaeon]